MGTSTSNHGQKGNTPLVPSWLDEDDGQLPVIPQPAVPGRFTTPRGNFTRYVNSGGRSNSNLHRAASDYVRHSLGGSENATKRLGSARSSTARMVSLFNSFANRGVAETSQTYGLGDIIGKEASDVFLRIMDFVCPDGGSTDEGIARSSFIEALASMSDWENKPIEVLTPQEFLVFTETFMSNVIEKRLVNDIGNKLFSLPDDISKVENIQVQLKEYTQGAVSDAISNLKVEIENIDAAQTQHIMDSVYQEAYTILSALEE